MSLHLHEIATSELDAVLVQVQKLRDELLEQHVHVENEGELDDTPCPKVQGRLLQKEPAKLEYRLVIPVQSIEMDAVHIERGYGRLGYLGQEDVVLAEDVAARRYTRLPEQDTVAELEHPVEQVVRREHLVTAGVAGSYLRRAVELALDQRLAAQEAQPVFRFDVAVFVARAQEPVELGGEEADQDLEEGAPDLLELGDLVGPNLQLARVTEQREKVA